LVENKNIGWERVLKLIIPYIFIVGFFQFMGMLIIGVDFKNYNPPPLVRDCIAFHYLFIQLLHLLINPNS